MSEELLEKKLSLKASLLEIVKSLDGIRHLYKIKKKPIYLMVFDIEFEQRVDLVKIVEENSECGHHYGTLKPLPQTWNECICFFPFRSKNGSRVYVTNPRTFNMLMNGPEYACETCELRNSHKEEENWACPNIINENLGEIFREKRYDVLLSAGESEIHVPFLNSDKPTKHIIFNACKKCGGIKMELMIENNGNCGEACKYFCTHCRNTTVLFYKDIDTAAEEWNIANKNHQPKKKAI